MAPTTRNAAGSGAGGAREDRLCWTLDDPLHTRNRRALQDSARVDELLVRLGHRLRLGRLSGFSRSFVKSILRQARRRGPRWRPSPRQLQVMREITARAADDDVVEVLIEELGDE